MDWKVVAVHHKLYEGDPKSESSVREITIDDGTVRVAALATAQFMAG